MTLSFLDHNSYDDKAEINIECQIDTSMHKHASDNMSRQINFDFHDVMC